MTESYREMILKLLSVCFAPISTKEIGELLEKPSSGVASALKRLEGEDLVTLVKEEGAKANSYLLNSTEEKKTLSFLVMKLHETGSSMQLEGYINLFDLAKIAGILPYRNYPKTGVQRVRQGAWTRELAKNLNESDSIMTNCIVLYMDKAEAEIGPTPIQDVFSDSKDLYNLNIQYKEYVEDTEKPVMILDGQQRMWAIQRIAIQQALVRGETKIANPFNVPVTFLIGDFDTTEEKIEFLIERFVNANNTKNLPRAFRAQLEAKLMEMYDGTEIDLRKKFSKSGIDAQVVNWLHQNEESPLKGIVKLEQRGSGFYGVSSLLVITRFFRRLIDADDTKEGSKKVYDILVDYYSVVKVLWPDDWQKPSSRYPTRLLDNIGLGSLAFFAETLIPYEVIHTSDRIKRRKEIVKRFLKIVDEINWDISRDSFKNNKPDLQRFAEAVLKRTYKANLDMYIDDEDIEKVLQELEHLPKGE